MCALKLISHTVPKVADKAFKRKYIALGRIVTHWQDIMGEKMARHAQPHKINYRKAKRKGDKPSATLEIACSSAHASLLMMQKGVLLEKINFIFGEEWITDIKFIHKAANTLNDQKPKNTNQTKALTLEEKNRLSQLLDKVSDNELKEKLSRMGQALITDQKN
ncbi:MAG: DciA family protein [Alphaproteobacteria bacterium]|nr:DciA family protein [Alphaproteobacteria bacterium]